MEQPLIQGILKFKIGEQKITTNEALPIVVEEGTACLCPYCRSNVSLARDLKFTIVIGDETVETTVFKCQTCGKVSCAKPNGYQLRISSFYSSE